MSRKKTKLKYEKKRERESSLQLFSTNIFFRLNVIYLTCIDTSGSCIFVGLYKSESKKQRRWQRL